MTKQRPTVEEQLSVEMIAEKLNVGTRTVWRWINTGKIAPVRRLGGKCTRVPVSAVNRFLETWSHGGEA